ncbi:mannosyltransferase [Desulfuromonas versatilis]|uniref:Mannosyltransferase n=1 Tax=Desulfuromonas versatilis TaxID=2802975 RepID=A0ABM8HZ49_9BACT|nr:glycosyltransferase [Desulfuromonas versatilis]BCR05798.1 mannosyltransferase [Desulfuromonas versatilis]
MVDKNRPYKVLVVCSNLGVGGAEVQLAKILVGLDREKFIVSVAYFMPIVDFPQAILCRGGVKTIFLGSEKWNKFKCLYEVAKFIKKEGFDIVHCWLHTANFYGGFPALMNRVPVVFGGLQGNVELCRPWDFVYRLLNFRFTSWIVNSQELKNNLKKNSGVNGNEISIVRNGVELPILTQEKHYKHSNEHGNSLTVGFAGRLHQIKNPLLFLHMAKTLLDGGIFAKFLVAGDGPMMEQVKKFVEENCLQDHVSLLGIVKEMEVFYRKIDILVLTSDSESCPNVLLEAMSYQIPVVSTRCTDMSSFLMDGKNGFVVDRGDVKNLVYRVKMLLIDGNIRKKMGKFGRVVVEEKFNLKNTVSELENVYLAACSKKLSRGRR